MALFNETAQDREVRELRRRELMYRKALRAAASALDRGPALTIRERLDARDAARTAAMLHEPIPS